MIGINGDGKPNRVKNMLYRIMLIELAYVVQAI